MDYWSIDENERSLKADISLLHHSAAPLWQFLACENCLTRTVD